MILPEAEHVTNASFDLAVIEFGSARWNLRTPIICGGHEYHDARRARLKTVSVMAWPVRISWWAPAQVQELLEIRTPQVPTWTNSASRRVANSAYSAVPSARTESSNTASGEWLKAAV